MGNDELMPYPDCRGLATGRPTGLQAGGMDSKTLAKHGMTVSLAALVATGFIGGKTSKRLHLVAGVALVGFSLWHHSLYPSSNRKG